MPGPFPNRPVRIIVPATPGGSSDVFTRAIAQKLQDAFGKPVMVEYKADSSSQFESRMERDAERLTEVLRLSGAAVVK